MSSSSSSNKKRKGVGNDDEQSLVQRLKSERDALATKVAKLNAQLRLREARNQELRYDIERMHMELDTADTRNHELSMRVFDLEESNSQYAVRAQNMMLNMRDHESEIQRLNEEMIFIIQVHHREMSVLQYMSQQQQQQQNTHEDSVDCPICRTDCKKYSVLTCKHVVCNSCLPRLETCPFCKRDIDVIAEFNAWW